MEGWGVTHINSQKMKVLFIGGTGIISSACSELAIKRGIDLYHLNRGQSKSIRNIEGVKQITADIRDVEATKKALAGMHFDTVVDWIAFETEHIANDIDIFKGITEQFIFISSASVYQTPPLAQPVTEETPRINPIWKYSQNKIACEELLEKEHKNSGFPYTIVRPSHTYDKTLIPMEGGYTVLNRMLTGKPVVVHGDGTSIWTLTHHSDFAKGLIGLCGNKEAIGEIFHITSDEWLSWNQINNIMAEALGVEAKIVAVPSETIARFNKDMGDSLLGDKTHSMMFDNSKLKKVVPDYKCTVPFTEGAKEIVKWYKENPEFQKVDEKMDKLFDDILEYHYR